MQEAINSLQKLDLTNIKEDLGAELRRMDKRRMRSEICRESKTDRHINRDTYTLAMHIVLISISTRDATVCLHPKRHKTIIKRIPSGIT